MSKLIIEIEADDINLISLLDHIKNEINDPFGHHNNDIEDFAELDGLNWLLVKNGPLKGKYRWNKR